MSVDKVHNFGLVIALTVGSILAILTHHGIKKRNQEIEVICQKQSTYVDDGNTKLCVNRGK